MGTAVVLVIIAAAVGLAVRSMIKDKRQGKSLQCGGDCKHCGGHCQ
ncbi:MAG: FeoB-associated Cys-rich membrane protein [Roseburia sp.]|nr:FeoB-associated Cys-rich membrane protein [Roseburia sp.]